jgi:hypothetical protein
VGGAQATLNQPKGEVASFWPRDCTQASQPGCYSQAKNSLHGDEESWHVEGLKENFGSSFPVFPWV